MEVKTGTVTYTLPGQQINIEAVAAQIGKIVELRDIKVQIEISKSKVISGYGNGKFGPMDKITREQAMTMIARAMSITGLKIEFANGEVEKILAGFEDAGKSAAYANNSIAACIKSGLVAGRNGKMVAPKDNITRAEVAVIVKRLLQKSNLI